MFFFLCFVFAPGMFYLGLLSAHDEYELSNRGVIVNGTAYDTQISYTHGPKTYDVKYRFTPDGGISWYFHVDRLGRTDLWYPVTEEQWQVTQATRQVKVLYLPDNPTINRPLHGTITIFDPLAGAFAGVFAWVCCLMILIYQKQYRKVQNA
jgi:hypothetical protein